MGMRLEDAVLLRAEEWADVIAIARQGYREALDNRDKYWLYVWHCRSIAALRGNSKRGSDSNVI